MRILRIVRVTEYLAIRSYILLLSKRIIDKVRRIYQISRRVAAYLRRDVCRATSSVLRDVKRLLLLSLGYLLFIILFCFEVLLESKFIFADGLCLCFAQLYFDSIA